MKEMAFDPVAHAPAATFERIVTLLVRLALYLCVPGVLLFSAVEVALGRGTLMLGGYVACQLLAAIAMFVTRGSSYRARAVVLVLYALSVMLMAMLHYGANIGTGIVVVAAAVWAGLFVGRRGAVAVALITAGLLVAMGLAAHAGWVPPSASASQDVRAVSNWIRFVFTMTVAAGALAWLVARVLGELQLTIERATHALVRRELMRDERRETERELQRAQRLDALARLAGGVGDDIERALAVVLSSAVRLHACASDDDRRELAEEVVAAARLAAATAQRLTALSEQAANEEDSAPLASTVERVTRALSRVFPAGISIRAALEFDGRVAMSSEALNNVLLNLCFNARDAMPEGGELVIESRSCDADRVEIAVSDTGVGMSDEVRERVFEPFFTTKDEEGTGLGMPTVRRLVNAAGGQVELESEPGRGTTVRLELPVLRKLNAREG